MFALQADRQRQAQVADAIRRRLAAAGAGREALARAYAPAARLRRMRLNAAGGSSRRPIPRAGSVCRLVRRLPLLTMSIFFSAGFLVQATIEDRQSRMIEILLSSVDPQQLVLGKILGLGGAGLLQVGIYVALVIVPGRDALGGVSGFVGQAGALDRVLRHRVSAVRVPDDVDGHDRSHVAGERTAVRALGACRGEPDVLHREHRRGAQRLAGPHVSRSFRSPAR